MSKFDMLGSHVWCDDHSCIHDITSNTCLLDCSEASWRRLWVGRKCIRPKYIDPHEEYLKVKAKNIESAKTAVNLFTRWQENDIQTVLKRDEHGEYAHTQQELAEMLGRSLKAIDGVRSRYRHYEYPIKSRVDHNG